MNIKNLSTIIFEKGKKAGLEDMELHVSKRSTINVNVFKGDVDNFKISDELGLSVRGNSRGKTGYAYTERTDKISLQNLIDQVVSNANHSQFYEPIYASSSKINPKDSLTKKGDKTDLQTKLQLPLNMETKAYALDPRIKLVNYCSYIEVEQKDIIINTKGTHIKDSMHNFSTSISVVSKEYNDVKTGHSHISSTSFDKICSDSIVKQSVDDAVNMLNAKSILSGEYEVILRNNVAASILHAFYPIFSAENAQKNISMLRGKLGEKVANDILTITDDPTYKYGTFYRKFDDEGTATYAKNIIANGVLKTFLHNNRSALKDQVNSTGNGFKLSFKDPVNLSPTNLYIAKGQNTLTDLINTVELGLLIIDVQGIHAGLNPISGDFTLASHGFLIKNGAVHSAVNQITIGGNFYDLLYNIDDIGNDLKFTYPRNGSVGSPSLKIKSLMVGGA